MKKKSRKKQLKKLQKQHDRLWGWYETRGGILGDAYWLLADLIANEEGLSESARDRLNAWMVQCKAETGIPAMPVRDSLMRFSVSREPIHFITPPSRWANS